MARCAHGADMKTAASRGSQNRPRVRDLALVGESIAMPLSRRARLLGVSALAGGTLRSLAIAAAGLTATTAMLAPVPAAAQFVCGGSATGAEPQTGAGAVATGIGDVACGSNANVNGGLATATGDGAMATGTNATATGGLSHAIGIAATATGVDSGAIGRVANRGFRRSALLANEARGCFPRPRPPDPRTARERRARPAPPPTIYRCRRPRQAPRRSCPRGRKACDSRSRPTSCPARPAEYRCAQSQFIY